MRSLADNVQQKGTTPTARALGRGTITFIAGCMFSGKTTELLRRLDALDQASIRTFKHRIDRRYRSHAVVSHGGLARPAFPVASMGEIVARIDSGTSVVAIDEAHFFDTALVDLTRDLAARGVDVILTSLDLDSWGRPFAVARRLRAIADEPIDRNAVCAGCGGPADHTQRLTPIIDGNMVGGPESYEPRCLTCWSPPPEPAPLRA